MASKRIKHDWPIVDTWNKMKQSDRENVLSFFRRPENRMKDPECIFGKRLPETLCKLYPTTNPSPETGFNEIKKLVRSLWLYYRYRGKLKIQPQNWQNSPAIVQLWKERSRNNI